jgi:hypothetical protein
MNKARPLFCVFFFTLDKIRSKYIKVVGIILESLASISQWESNDTNYVQYNQDFVAHFFLKISSNMRAPCSSKLG